jgi:hypothetical protein
MNLLGMKRKLLPYGMPLGGTGGSIGSALGTMGNAFNSAGSAAPSSSGGGGKSSGAGGAGYGGAPSFGGGGGSAPNPNTGGGKSSGLGQGGYGGAPQYTGVNSSPPSQLGALNSIMSGLPVQQTPFNSSVNTTTQQDMMGGNRGGMPAQGGKSSGLGQGGYGGAPGLGVPRSSFNQDFLNSMKSNSAAAAKAANPYGFTAPTGPSTQAFVPFYNSKTGETYMAPGGGYTPPSADWVQGTPGQPSQQPTQGGFNQGFNQFANPNMGSGLRGFNGTFSPEAEAFQRANPQPQQPTSQMEDMVRMMGTGAERGTDPAVADQMRNQLSGMRENFMRNPPQQMSSEQFRQSGGFNQPSQFGGFGGRQLGGFGGMGGQQLGGFDPLDMTQDAQRQRQMQQQPLAEEQAQQQGGMGAAASQRQMQGGFGPQAPNTSEQAYRQHMAMANYRGGGAPSYEQWKSQQENRFSGMGGLGRSLGNIPGNPGFPDPRTRNQQPQQNMQGIQDLFSRMMGQFQQQQMPQQMPRFQSPALGYRPDMTQAQQSLGRVRPSVQKERQDSQAARIAELEAQLAGYQNPTNSSDGGGG